MDTTQLFLIGQNYLVNGRGQGKGKRQNKTRQDKATSPRGEQYALVLGCTSHSLPSLTTCTPLECNQIPDILLSKKSIYLLEKKLFNMANSDKNLGRVNTDFYCKAIRPSHRNPQNFFAETSDFSIKPLGSIATVLVLLDLPFGLSGEFLDNYRYAKNLSGEKS